MLLLIKVLTWKYSRCYWKFFLQYSPMSLKYIWNRRSASLVKVIWCKIRCILLQGLWKYPLSLPPNMPHLSLHPKSPLVLLPFKLSHPTCLIAFSTSIHLYFILTCPAQVKSDPRGSLLPTTLVNMQVQETITWKFFLVPCLQQHDEEFSAFWELKMPLIVTSFAQRLHVV